MERGWANITALNLKLKRDFLLPSEPILPALRSDVRGLDFFERIISDEYIAHIAANTSCARQLNVYFKNTDVKRPSWDRKPSEIRAYIIFLSKQWPNSRLP